MRPIFCGNFEYETRQSDLERLFSKYGRVDRVDMKSGFAFVYFEDERDAEDAIRGLDNIPFGYDRRRLSVEWARGERGRHRDGRAANQRPTKTLFVINFDPVRTRDRDIERHFEPYGKVLNVRVRRNFAFVQFETQDDATKALECTHMSKILDRVVSVEYALRDDDERGGRIRVVPEGIMEGVVVVLTRGHPVQVTAGIDQAMSMNGLRAQFMIGTMALRMTVPRALITQDIEVGPQHAGEKLMGGQSKWRLTSYI